METRQRRRLVSGFTLIGLGLALYLLREIGDIGTSVVFFVIGGGFLAAYFYRRQQGFLVPAGVLLGLAFGDAFHEFLFDYGDPFLIGLGLGFLAIFAIGLLYERRFQWWPLFPASALLLAAFPGTDEVFEWLFRNWPIMLVIIGVLIVLGALVGGRGHERRDP